MNSKVIILGGLIIMSMALSGCGPKRIAYNQRIFVLETSRNHPRQKTSKDIILDVQSFSVNTTFGTRSLIYRKSQSEYETDFYNQFLIRPEDMITEQTRDWFSESGLFKWVLEPGSYADVTHTLQGNIIALYGDFREDPSPKATMKMRFFLIEVSEKSIVFAKTYEAVSGFVDSKAESLIEAYDVCLTNILSDLERDLQEQL
jgi:ABC-type uncharacterized transport system auxiliary subunit